MAKLRCVAGLRLPPRIRDLAIDYTALSLVVPEKVRFRFKLEGQDATGEKWSTAPGGILESAAGGLSLPRYGLQ